MTAKVTGLGHVGIYVHDLELMKEFYGTFMGMTLTKVGPAGAFLVQTQKIATMKSL